MTCLSRSLLSILVLAVSWLPAVSGQTLVLDFFNAVLAVNNLGGLDPNGKSSCVCVLRNALAYGWHCVTLSERKPDMYRSEYATSFEIR